MALNELYGSRSLTLSKAGAGTSRRLFLVGWNEWLMDTVTGVPKINDPHPYHSALRVSNIIATPYGKSKDGTRADEYDYAKLEVEYTTPQYSELVPKYTWEVGGDMLEVGQGRHWVTSEGSAVDAPVYVLVPMVELTVQVTSATAPTGNLFGKVGCLNADTYLNWPRGRILYLGATTTTEFNGNGSLATWQYNIAYKFKCNPLRDHNYFYNPDVADWQLVVPNVYPYADLSI